MYQAGAVMSVALHDDIGTYRARMSERFSCLILSRVDETYIYIIAIVTVSSVAIACMLMICSVMLSNAMIKWACTTSKEDIQCVWILCASLRWKS